MSGHVGNLSDEQQQCLTEVSGIIDATTAVYVLSQTMEGFAEKQAGVIWYAVYVKQFWLKIKRISCLASGVHMMITSGGREHSVHLENWNGNSQALRTSEVSSCAVFSPVSSQSRRRVATPTWWFLFAEMAARWASDLFPNTTWQLHKR